MNSYEDFQLHAQKLMAEAELERTCAALTAGKPGIIQSAATSLGHALIRLGTWLAQAAPSAEATSEA